MKKETVKSGVNKNSMMSKAIWGVLLIQLGLIGWLGIKEYGSSDYKIGYVEISKVYDEFTLTKKLNEDFTKMQTAKQGQMDTLKLRIERMEMDIQQGNKSQLEEYGKMKSYYDELQDQVNKDNMIVQNKYLEQISGQLNSLVKEYGEKNHYDVILGANGDGNIMHGNEGLNITEEVIAYINQSVEQWKNY